MVFYGSDFYVLEKNDISEERISNTLDRLILEYQDRYFKSSNGHLAKVDARWCIFYNTDNTPKYFYCFTIVEFSNNRQLNCFKIKNPDLYQKLIESGFTIKIAEIESRLYA